MSTIQPDTTAQSSDYYGTVYKGPFLIPLLGIIIMAVAIVVLLKSKRRK